jgi:two-component system OmpR family response regulator
MEAQPSILIVDDDREIRTLLADFLEANGYRSRAVPDGAGMWGALESGKTDLVVLDLTLPGDDGLTLCRTLRAKSTLPVIMLTARGAALDRIVGLEMGADDYLAKPFEPRELLARIRNVLRRSQGPHLPRNAARIRFGQWILDVQARHLIDEAGTIVALSGSEFRLLSVFLERPNRILNRDQLLDLTHGRDADSFERSIDLQVSRLRQRLRDDARASALIKTVRSEGYVLSAAVSIES